MSVSQCGVAAWLVLTATAIGGVVGAVICGLTVARHQRKAWSSAEDAMGGYDECSSLVRDEDDARRRRVPSAMLSFF